MKNKVTEQMHQHVSVRQYTGQDIPETDLNEILSAAQGAASSDLIQSYSVIAVKDPAKKRLLAQCTNNPQVATCSVFLVFCADLVRLQEACKKYGKKIESNSIENLLVVTVDTTLFAQNVALAAESMGYGICFIGGVRNDPAKVCEILDIPHLAYPVFGMTLGVPMNKNEVKPRLPLSAILHHDSYDSKKYATLLAEYDQIMQEYYGDRGSNQRDDNWSHSMSQVVDLRKRPHMRAFLNQQGFKAE